MSSSDSFSYFRNTVIPMLPQAKVLWWPAVAILFAFVCFQYVESTDDPLVKIPQGELRGAVQKSRNGRTYYEFLGIPYGKVPKRFAVAEPADNWDGIRDATVRGPWCMQTNAFLNKLEGVEDCLVLNLYTPKIPSSPEESQGYPVLFWIHGGAFILGSGNEYGGNYVMNENVILVSINYRLGAFGFLNAGVEGASGNQGIKDAVLGLQWVQQNIKYFGGDPNKVVVFGESAGGGATSLLTLAPMAKGLFHGAISMSGVALSPFTNRKEDPLKEAKKLAIAMDCPTSDATFMVECLRRISPIELTKGTISTHPSHWFFDVESTPQFAPSVETFMTSPDQTILPSSILNILEEGSFNRVPWIAGVNQEEGVLIMSALTLLNDTLRDLLNSEWGRVAPHTFLYNVEARDTCKISSQVRSFYFGDAQEISMKNSQALVDLYGDRFFNQPAKETLQLYSKFAPAYGYNFTRKVKHSIGEDFNWPYSSERKNPTHGDELQYLFDFPVVAWGPGIKKGDPDEALSDDMISSIVSFARDLKPTHWGKEKVTWPTASEKGERMNWLNIGDEGVQVLEEDEDMNRRTEFWQNVLNGIRKNPRRP